jgi:hypothetical protein
MWGETALNRRGYTPSERFLNLLQAGFVYVVVPEKLVRAKQSGEVRGLKRV